jgi:hypothetical protein
LLNSYKILFDTEEIRKAFIVYLISSDRPMHDILNPNKIDISSIFEEEFQAMSKMEAPMGTLLATRDPLIKTITEKLTNLEREFLMTLKSGEPKWELLDLPDIKRLPGVQWKLINIQKMNSLRQQQQFDTLEKSVIRIRKSYVMVPTTYRESVLIQPRYQMDQ